MMLTKYLVELGAIAVALLAVPAANADDSKPRKDDNAALQYWQAFSQLPTLDADQEKLLDEWHKAPLDTATKKLIAASESSLMYLHRGAKLDRCNWGLEFNDGVSLLLPHLAKARVLGRLAALRARSHFHEGNFDTGREDLTAVLTLARQISKDPIMISVLVGNSIEGTAIDALAPHVPKLKSSAPKFASMFDRLPRPATAGEVIKVEKEYMARWIIQKLQQAEKDKSGSWKVVWKSLLDGSSAPESLKQIDSVSEATEMIESLMPVYDELVQVVELPPQDLAKRYAEIRERSKSQSLAAVLLPAVDRYMSALHRQEARQVMLMAALKIAEQGPDAAKQSRDPFDDGPFAYKATADGFELQSKLLHEYKPVTLTLGVAKD